MALALALTCVALLLNITGLCIAVVPMRHGIGTWYEYQYVRQWSVDVAALADQLENPKAHLATSHVTLGKPQSTPDHLPCDAGITPTAVSARQRRQYRYDEIVFADRTIGRAFGTLCRLSVCL